MYETKILVIGAGPVGLTLAIDLARRDIPFRLIEAADAPFPGSRGKGIQPRTLEIFDDLGVIKPVLEAGGLYPNFRIHGGPLSLRIGSLGSRKPATEDVPYPNLWMLGQFRTEEILRERVEELGGTVEFSRALATFRQDASGVDAVLENGEEIRAEYLVGCDGGHSTVRKQLGLSLKGESIDEDPMLVADVEVKGLDQEDWHLWPFRKGGPIGLCPLPNSSLFQLTARADTMGEDIPAGVKKAAGYAIDRIVWSSIYRPAVRMVDRYRVGRVFLAGDAAHVHPPSGGQGLNTGVQDAYNLGWKLACVVRGSADSLLDTYEEERKPVAAAVLGLSKRLYQERSLKRGDATNQLALHYRGSSLASGDTLAGLLPGDRMPDLSLACGETLFARMRGPHATELATVEGPRILIRPDGYIASIGREENMDYLGLPLLRVTAANAFHS